MDLLIFFYFWLADIIQGNLQFYFSALFTGKHPRISHYSVLSLLLIPCYIAGMYFQAPPLSLLLNIVILYGANRLLLNNKGFISFLTAVLAVSLTLLSYGIFNALSDLLLFCLKIESSLLFLVGVISCLLSLILFYCSCRLIARYFTLNTEFPSQYLFMILTPALLLCAMGYYIVNTAYGNITIFPSKTGPGKHMELLAVQTFGFLALFSTLYACKRLCESFSAKARLTLLLQETHAQRAYVAEAKMRYEQTISFRHDIKNHLTVLDGLLRQDKTEQAKDYLAKLNAATKELSFPVHTGNPIVDILSGSKSELAGQMGIKMNFSLTLPKPGTLDDLDLCVIFSNALDNAIHACALSDGEKTIGIAGERQGDFYMLEFENDCPPQQSSSVKIGTGLSNIKTVAQKYGGAVTMEQRADHFYLHVLLNIPKT